MFAHRKDRKGFSPFPMIVCNLVIPNTERSEVEESGRARGLVAMGFFEITRSSSGASIPTCRQREAAFTYLSQGPSYRSSRPQWIPHPYPNANP